MILRYVNEYNGKLNSRRSIKGDMNPAHTVITYFFTSHLNIVLPFTPMSHK